jgi:hypothetical protein
MILIMASPLDHSPNGVMRKQWLIDCRGTVAPDALNCRVCREEPLLDGPLARMT